MSRLLSVAALSVALFSCADEEIVGGGPRVQEGLPAKIVLKVVSNENRIETRAAQPDENEMRVNNLYVFVFDEDEMSVKKEAGFTVILIQQRMIMERLQEILSLRPVRKTMRKLRVLPTSRRATSTPLMNSRKTS